MCKNQTKKLFFCFCILIAVTFGFATIGAAAKINLKFGHETNINSACQVQAEIFKELVEKRTNGEITVTIYPGGTLTGSPEELLEFLISGTVDISLTATGNVSGFLDDLQFLNLPFLFKNFGHLNAGLESFPVRQILDKFEEKVGVKAVGLSEDGTGTCITSINPIRSFKDMKNFKIRCMMNPIFIDMYKAFGSAPTPIDWSELYTSLKMGAVEGQDNAPFLSYTTKFFEVQNAVAVTQHYWSGFIMLLSKSKLDKLTPKQQQILIQTGRETNIMQIEYCHRMDKITLDKLAKQGKVVTYPDMKPFEKAMPVVYDKWFQKYPHWKAWYEEIQKINPETVSPKAGLPKM